MGLYEDFINGNMGASMWGDKAGTAELVRKFAERLGDSPEKKEEIKADLTYILGTLKDPGSPVIVGKAITEHVSAMSLLTAFFAMAAKEGNMEAMNSVMVATLLLGARLQREAGNEERS